MGRLRRITRSEDAAMTRRLLAAMPATHYEMETLTRLAGIKVSRSLPTAAVECKHRPNLLINPDFVAEHCPRDEHLFLLVMHELWHVQLAHTRMYPQMTTLQNIALDAVINAGLMRMFPEPEYRGFFDVVNPADKFPSCLLRPPEGWPYAPQYPKDVGPPGTEALLKRLYPPGNMHFGSPPLYEEVLSLLLQGGMKWIEAGYMLLGNHDGRPTNDPIMKELINEMSDKLVPVGFEGRGNGRRMGKRRYSITPGSEDMRRVFARTLRLTLGRRPGRSQRKGRTTDMSMGGSGVMPNPHDRTIHARRKMGGSTMLYTQPTEVRARLPEKPSRAFVYLDVSGSMNMILPHMLGLLLPYVADGRAEVFQFSNVVTPLSYQDLKRGDMTTTGGTDINPVLEHLVSVTPAVDKVLILTDGAVGLPRPDLKAAVLDLAPQLYVVIHHEGRMNNGMDALVTSLVRLPRIS